MNKPVPYRPAYRAYVVAPGGEILLSHELDCDTDEQAVRKAAQYAAGNLVELWDRGRKVAVIPLSERRGR